MTELSKRWLAAGLLLCGSAIAGTSTTFQGCDGCHGTDGISRAEHVPTIRGLNVQYFYGAMQGFKRDQRTGMVMGRIAKGYKTGQLQRMALHYGTQPWAGQPRTDSDPVLAEKGRNLYQDWCEKCHKDNGRFQDKDTPPLAGQAKGYLINQMHDYRRADPSMPQPALMQERLEKLSDDDLLALAEFLTSELAFRPQ